MWKLIDNRTLLLASTLVVGAFAPLLLLFKRAHRTYPGVEQWARGLACFGLSALLQGMRGSISDFFPIILGNALGLIGLISICKGIHTFCGKAWNTRGAYLAAAFCMVLLYWFRYIHPDERVRIIVFALFEFILAMRCGAPFVGLVPPGRNLSYRFCAVVFVTMSLALAFRVVSAIFSPDPASALDRSTSNGIYFISLLLGTLGSIFGVFLLTWERLVQELHEANGSLAAESAERLRMEKRVADAERMETMGRMAGGIAHYFNNQMCIINGYCSLLLRPDGVMEPVRTTIQAVLKAGEHTAQLTDRLLTFSQVKLLDPVTLPLANWLRLIEPEILRELGEHLKLTLFGMDSGVAALADPKALTRAVLAMARNAREAMPKEGTLSISLAEIELPDGSRARELGLRPGRYASITIQDTGTGMDAETLRHVFEPFFTTKGLANAEGLSLASAFGFVKQSGGTITVESAPGAGSTFRVILPVSGPEPS